MSFIIGEADYINSLMECFNCIFNPKFPTVGELWQVFTDYRQWRRRCEGNYTLSSLAHTQREELSQLKRSIEKRRRPSSTTNDSTNELYRPTNELVSSPPSVGSKRQRSPSSTRSNTSEKRAITEPISNHLKDVRVSDFPFDGFI